MRTLASFLEDFFRYGGSGIVNLIDRNYRDAIIVIIGIMIFPFLLYLLYRYKKYGNEGDKFRFFLIMFFLFISFMSVSIVFNLMTADTDSVNAEMYKFNKNETRNLNFDNDNKTIQNINESPIKCSIYSRRGINGYYNLISYETIDCQSYEDNVNISMFSVNRGNCSNKISLNEDYNDNVNINLNFGQTFSIRPWDAKSENGGCRVIEYSAVVNNVEYTWRR